MYAMGRLGGKVQRAGFTYPSKQTKKKEIYIREEWKKIGGITCV